MDERGADLSAGLRAALSFACAFVGWSAGIAWYVVFCVYGGLGYVTDFGPIVFWSACFVALDWLVVMLPLALRVSREGALVRAGVAPPFGAVAGYACLVALLLPLGGIQLAASPAFAVQAALVGALAWSLFALGLRRPGRFEREKVTEVEVSER